MLIRLTEPSPKKEGLSIGIYMKKCCKCKQVKQFQEFHKNKTTLDGLHYRCKRCNNNANKTWYKNHKDAQKQRVKLWAQQNPDKNTAKSVKYKVSKVNRTPKWLNKKQLSDIQKFYTQAVKLSKKHGISYEVDHIVPLRGKNVSGLHVPWNLRVITSKQNKKKKNSFS